MECTGEFFPLNVEALSITQIIFEQPFSCVCFYHHSKFIPVPGDLSCFHTSEPPHIVSFQHSIALERRNQDLTFFVNCLQPSAFQLSWAANSGSCDPKYWINKSYFYIFMFIYVTHIEYAWNCPRCEICNKLFGILLLFLLQKCI